MQASSLSGGLYGSQFKLLGLVPVNAPPSAKGKLDITYVDEDLRISRGDRGAAHAQAPAMLSLLVCLGIPVASLAQQHGFI